MQKRKDLVDFVLTADWLDQGWRVRIWAFGGRKIADVIESTRHRAIAAALKLLDAVDA